jgi:hypothetical protein
MTSRIYDVLDDPPFLISPYNSDSWYCGGEIVKYDLTRKPVSKRYKLLPKNFKRLSKVMIRGGFTQKTILTFLFAEIELL